MGRCGVFELMDMESEELRSLVVRGASLDEIRSVARREGMRPLLEAAWAHATAGRTTVGEAARVVGEEQEL